MLIVHIMRHWVGITSLIELFREISGAMGAHVFLKPAYVIFRAISSLSLEGRNNQLLWK